MLLNSLMSWTTKVVEVVSTSTSSLPICGVLSTWIIQNLYKVMLESRTCTCRHVLKNTSLTVSYNHDKLIIPTSKGSHTPHDDWGGKWLKPSPLCSPFSHPLHPWPLLLNSSVFEAFVWSLAVLWEAQSTDLLLPRVKKLSIIMDNLHNKC